MKFFSIKKSLFASLILIFSLTAFAFLVLFSLSFKHLRGEKLNTLTLPFINQYVEYIIADIGIPPNKKKAEEITKKVKLRIRIVGPTTTWASHPEAPQKGHAISLPYKGDRRRFFRLLHRQAVQVERGGYTFIFAAPEITGWESDWPLKAAFLLSVLIVLFACYKAVRWLFRPIEWVKDGADRIGKGELKYRIPVTSPNELGELTESVNRMATDIEKMMEAKRQLLIAMSHELRSPLTRSKVSLEFIENDRVKVDLANDLNEMESLIADLLEAERLNTPHGQLQKSEVSFPGLLQEVISKHFKKEKLRLQITGTEENLIVTIDATRIKFLVKNLIDNALRHSSKTASSIDVKLKKSEGSVCFAVTDRGEGISEEHLKKITEPFYRVDPSRQKKTGGYGLGLYLCRLIAEAHGGCLSIKSKEGEGTTVEFHFLCGLMQAGPRRKYGTDDRSCS
ncbi:MAG: sensor histidine kinase [Nitrospinota bacterium]